MCKVMDDLRNDGIEQGIELMDKLYSQGRTEDAKRAKTDPQYRDQLMKELAIQQAQPLLPTPWGAFLFTEAPMRNGVAKTTLRCHRKKFFDPSKTNIF